MRTYIFTVAQLTKLLTRRYFRSRLAIFFSIIFPLIFLFVFGGLFGGNNNASFKVAVINHSDSQFSKTFNDKLSEIKTLNVQKDIKTVDEGKQKMNRSEIDSIIELPQNFGASNAQGIPAGQAVVYYDENNLQAGQTVASVLNSILGGINAQLIRVQPPLTAVSKSTNDKGLSSFDYVFSGLLGFSILGLGVFGPVNMLPAEKKTGALTRLRVTPLKPSQFIIAYMLSSLATGALSIACMFAVAITVFHFEAVGSYLTFTIFALISAITIFGIGVGVGGWAKDERQAAPLSNIVAFPMMFLSGVFFPRFLMPEWLQNISGFLPLTPAIDGMRYILTEGKTLMDLGPQLAILGVWILVVYTIAFRVFRWE